MELYRGMTVQKRKGSWMVIGLSIAALSLMFGLFFGSCVHFYTPEQIADQAFQKKYANWAMGPGFSSGFSRDRNHLAR
jgi:hypothetical protein